MRVRLVTVLTTLLLIAPAAPSQAAGPTPDREGAAPSSWIVTLEQGVDVGAGAPGLAREAGGGLGHLYQHALDGFEFRGSARAAEALSRSPRVRTVVANRPVHLLAETVTPGLLAIDPTSDRLYSTRSMSAVNAPARIAVINRLSMLVEEVEVLIARPHGLAIAPDGKHVYAASLGTNQIAVYDAAREHVGIIEVRGGDTSQVLVQLAVSIDPGCQLSAAMPPAGQIVPTKLSVWPTTHHGASNVATWRRPNTWSQPASDSIAHGHSRMSHHN